jgi:hypothetical protein
MNNPKPDLVGSASRRWAGVADAAEYAACGLTKFWGMMQSGSVIAVRNGGKIVVDLNSIDAFYERCEPVAKRHPGLDELNTAAVALELAVADSGKPAHAPGDNGQDNPPGTTEAHHEPLPPDVGIR